MRKYRIFFFALLIINFHYISAQESNIVPGNLLVMLNSNSEAKNLCEELFYLNSVQTDLKVERVLSQSMHIYLFSFNAVVIDQDKLLTAVKNHPLVKIAQFNHLFQERAIPNDTQFGVMWNMNNTGQSGGTADADIDAPEAWNITTGGLTSDGDTIVVAVIDGGFDLAQQDLSFWKNYQEIPNNSIDDDNNGYVDDYDGWNGGNATDDFPVLSHGTHVSGIVGAKGNNGIGVTGVNWNVKIMAVSYGTYSNNGGLEANSIAAYSYIRDQRKLYNQTNGTKGAFVVATNSSFGLDAKLPSEFPMWCAMYDSLGAVGILSAGATSNSNNNVDAVGDIPTACTSNWLITVTNTTRNDGKATAGYGATTIDLGAPGSSITSTYPSNGYASISGTSMATPHVAGTIALMYSIPCSPLISNYKSDPAGVALIVKDSLLNVVDQIGALSGITVTGGRLNLYKAVNAMQNYCADVSVSEKQMLNNENKIKSIYPNPANNIINIIYTTNGIDEISIVNVLGQETKRIQTKNLKGIQHTKIDVSDMDKGIYFVSINAIGEKSNVVKIVIN